ncbi:MAG TPA: SPFH domain-containing protein [Kiritimatiellia bacterium]|nr:SPFH domain-containing protein [Kiritimatiellia bacterium]HRZ13503.1 SPFH domain-containing protein [Kiritimatiellia bacterium]HSA19192.1 SPFH domain-containing protein [Kiritimatiellia bacterium]
MLPIVVLAFVILIVSTIMFLAARYKRCPSDRILVIYGKVADNRSARCMHGGGTLVWPLIQDYAFLSLTPMTISIPLQNALSQQNIRINVPSTFTVGISVDPNIMLNAAERLLGLESGDIEAMAKEIIFGQLRLTVASLTIEQINQDRESFLESIRKNVEPELNKIGLYLINVNITDITDESLYIESIGKKAAAEAVNKARVDVAEQDKVGAIGQAEANREQTVRVAENVAAAEKGKKKAEADQRIYVQGQEAQAVGGENTAKADIADSNSLLAVKQAAAMQKAEVARREAQVQIQKAQYLAEQERLNAELVVQREIEKRNIEIMAEAEAERIRREAKGQADGTLLKYEAEAKGVRLVLDSKAAGYTALVKSCNGDAKAAATFLMVEKIEAVVARQVEAIRNLKIDKITVWDSAGGGEKGSSTANFVSSLIKSVPPLQDVASMAGVELPEYLGRMTEDKAKKKPAGEA